MTLRESLALTLGLDTALPLPQTTLTKLPKEKFMKGERVVALDLCTRVGGGGLSLRASLNPRGETGSREHRSGCPGLAGLWLKQQEAGYEAQGASSGRHAIA